MHQKEMCVLNHSRIWFFCLVVLFDASVCLWGQPLPGGWHQVRAEHVSLERSRDRFSPAGSHALQKSQVKTNDDPALEANSITSDGLPPTTPTPTSPEINELAKGLEYDPKAMFDFVHNQIEFVPYSGFRKGPTLTLLDRSGNDLDQAALLVALLEAGSYTARYAYGYMNYSDAQIVNWVGTDTYQISSALSWSGIPFNWIDGGYRLERFWVILSINGVDYPLDPAYKQYTEIPRANLTDSIFGYNRTNFISATLEGATLTPDYVQNLNEANLRTKLTEYSANLAAYLRSNYPNAEVSDVVGGRRIQQTELKTLPEATTLASYPLGYYTFSDMNDVAFDKVRIQFRGIDKTFRFYELGGKRVTLSFSGAGLRPELRVNGSLMATGTVTTAGVAYTATVTFDHYWPDQADQTATASLTSGSANIHALVLYAGKSSPALLQGAYSRLNQYIEEKQPPNSEAMRGESLNLIGLNYVRQFMLNSELSGAIHDTMRVEHHLFGFVEQTDTIKIDMIGNVLWEIGKRYNSASPEHVNSATFTAWENGSTLEHGVIEQTPGLNVPGLSSVKVLQLNNERAGKSLFLRTNNFGSYEATLLQTYDAATVTKFRSFVNGGGWLLLPDNGRVTLAQWQGMAWIGIITNTSPLYDDVAGYRLGGGLHGGAAGGVCTADGLEIDDWYTGDETSPSGFRANNHGSVSHDPVDLSTGFFLFDSTDLTLGSGEKDGIAISRSYNSGDRRSVRAFGHGWSHGHEFEVKKASNGESCLGARQPLDAIAAITYLYVIKDVFQALVGCPYGNCPDSSYKQDLHGQMLTALASKWLVDQWTQNSITVRLGPKPFEYIRLPDGSYSVPPGITTQLAPGTNGSLSLVERNGTHFEFATNGLLSMIMDADGNVVSYKYSGTLLQSVSNSFGRSLSFGYTTNLVTSITDSAGRSVSYGYDTNANLTRFTDPRGNSWRFAYDSAHRLVAVTNPVQVVSPINLYDSLDRVVSQQIPKQTASATYSFSYAGTRTVEVDPGTNRTTHFFDNKGREIVTENAFGLRSAKQYDGQNHVVLEVDVRGNETAYKYDGNQNVTAQTNALRQVTSYTYDSRHRLVAVTNPLGKTSRRAYDTKNHLIAATNALGNVNTYAYTSNGLLQSNRNARGTSSYTTYDSHGSAATNQVGAHPPAAFVHDAAGNRTVVIDHVGTTTAFRYDTRRFVTNITDPQLRSVIHAYDELAQLRSKTDRNTNTINYTYIPTGKINTIVLPDAPAVVFRYNKHDDLTQMADSTGTNSYGYDALHRLVAVTNSFGLTISYAYDAAGNVTAITHPGEKTVEYSYDELNRLKTVVNWLGMVTIYIYDDGGRIASVTHFNGSVSNFSYDDADRLLGLTHNKSAGPAIVSFLYSLDANGNRTNVGTSGTLDTLLKTRATSYSYNAQRNRLLSQGGQNYGYDSEGQLRSVNTTNLTFDSQGRLRRIEADVDIQYTYDGAGHRVSRSVGGVITRFIYDSQGRLLAETDGSNKVLRYYLYGLGLLALVTPEGEVFDYHFDGNGNTVCLTDSDQSVADSYSYTAFGQVANQVESIPQPYTFVGQFGVRAEGFGLYYMQARYYDSGIGRFISQDPLGFEAGDLNLYRYVGNNPISQIDPSGLVRDQWQIEWGAGGSGGGGVYVPLPLPTAGPFMEYLTSPEGISRILALHGLSDPAPQPIKDIVGAIKFISKPEVQEALQELSRSSSPSLGEMNIPLKVN
jgi:RHS repeat-associated protein